ncbi:hypothetical protein B0H13DRAFT_2375650 [Mycena leptocephala]|nr:hypothetical protein B0H13DRAFT_2375650 [Mycena leptocephala]
MAKSVKKGGKKGGKKANCEQPYCLPTSISAPDIDTVPLLLDQICCGWRKIVRSSPGLWTSLKVDGIHIPVALIETWLSRAPTMRLSLVLEVPDSEETQWDTAPLVVAVERYSGPGAISILQYTPNIEKFAATIYNRGSDRLPDVSPLMFLASLTLGTQIPEVLDIFDNISVPALQVLDLSNILFSGRELVARLHTILSNPDCRLRELIMETQPTLEKFELRTESLCLPIAMCRRLTDGSPFLPHLGLDPLAVCLRCCRNNDDVSDIAGSAHRCAVHAMGRAVRILRTNS